MEIRTGQLLPDLTLPAVARAAGPVALRGGRGPRAVVALHGSGCGPCREYAREVADAAGAAAEWGGRMVVVVPEGGDALSAGSPDAGAIVVHDPGGSLVPGAPFAVVADEWGEVYFAAEGAGGGEEGQRAHGLPDPAELAEWIRFAAIQCPECEGPEGAWRTL